MFFEKLSGSDFVTLAIIFCENVDAKISISNINDDKVLSLNLPNRPKFIFKDFDVEPANVAAAEYLTTLNIKNKYFKYMGQKFGAEYIEQLINYKKEKLNDIISIFN